MALVHTPYDGSSEPFTIGLKPMDYSDWIEIDAHLPAYLAEKDRLYAEIPEKVFVAEDGTEEAQAEILALLCAHLPERFAGTYRLCGSVMEIAGVDRPVPLDGIEPPLLTASRLVQEDLILMRKGEDGWRLAAGSLCFPSSWDLREKFGRVLSDIHAPVPQFGRGTRAATIIERMFDSLQGQAVHRYNWSLQANPDLYHPLSAGERDHRAAIRRRRFESEDPVASAFVRVERQTLRKLPVSRDVLFTIRIHVDPMRKLREHPDGAHLASSFADQLQALDTDQLDYKGLAADRDALVGRLRSLAGTG